MAIEHDPRGALYYLCRAMAKRCLGKVESSREDVALGLRLGPTDSKVQPCCCFSVPSSGNGQHSWLTGSAAGSVPDG